jgi:hypothetical protein
LLFRRGSWRLAAEIDRRVTYISCRALQWDFTFGSGQ